MRPASIEILDPEMEPGRITVIHRMGHSKVADVLPKLVDAVQKSGRSVLWCCDPMHGNTETVANGRKTRRFENILSELEQSFDIHHDMGSYLGGIHFEPLGGELDGPLVGVLAVLLLSGCFAESSSRSPRS